MSTTSYVHHYQAPATPGAPVWVLLHGTGGNEGDLPPVLAQIAPGAGWLALRGPVLEGSMARFFRRIREGVFDQESLRAETERFSSFLTSARTKYGLAGTRLIGLGFSNGANLLASYLLSGGKELAGAVLWRAQTPFQPASIAVGTTSVLIASGRYDPIVPLADAEHLAKLLAAGGAHVAHELFNCGHQLTRDDLACTARWQTALLNPSD